MTLRHLVTGLSADKITRTLIIDRESQSRMTSQEKFAQTGLKQK